MPFVPRKRSVFMKAALAAAGAAGVTAASLALTQLGLFGGAKRLTD
jgi:hypothetical protein